MSTTNNNNNNACEERAAVTRSESFDSLYYIEQLYGDKDAVRKEKQEIKITNVNNPILSSNDEMSEPSSLITEESVPQEIQVGTEIATTDSSDAKPAASSSNAVVEMEVDIRANENDSSFWLDASNSFWLQSCTELLQVY